MQRRTFVRSGLAGALFAPALSLRPAAAQTTRATTLLRSDPVRLSQNENPLGMPASARQAIVHALDEGHRYPRLNAAVIERVAAANNVPPGSVLLGNGSAEVLQMVIQAASARGRARVILPEPTYEVARYATAMGADVVRVPLLPDHTHDLQRMREAAAAANGPVFVFICNPNNPTGTVTPCEAVAAWIHAAPEAHWFLVDEAYYEFATDPAYRSFAADAVSRPNLVVSRTFSKIYGLAGVRLGYGIAHPDTIRSVNAFAAGNAINHLAAAAGLACLDEAEFVQRSHAVNRDGLRYVYTTLSDLGIEYLPSHANFVMHRIRGDHQAYVEALRAEGVITGRAFPPMQAYNRVSVGLPAEMERWAAAVRVARRQGLV